MQKAAAERLKALKTVVEVSAAAAALRADTRSREKTKPINITHGFILPESFLKALISP